MSFDIGVSVMDSHGNATLRIGKSEYANREIGDPGVPEEWRMD